MGLFLIVGWRIAPAALHGIDHAGERTGRRPETAGSVSWGLAAWLALTADIHV
jgi:hypothetical protein